MSWFSSISSYTGFAQMSELEEKRTKALEKMPTPLHQELAGDLILVSEAIAADEYQAMTRALASKFLDCEKRPLDQGRSEETVKKCLDRFRSNLLKICAEQKQIGQEKVQRAASQLELNGLEGFAAEFCSGAVNELKAFRDRKAFEVMITGLARLALLKQSYTDVHPVEASVLKHLQIQPVGADAEWTELVQTPEMCCSYNYDKATGISTVRSFAVVENLNLDEMGEYLFTFSNRRMMWDERWSAKNATTKYENSEQSVRTGTTFRTERLVNYFTDRQSSFQKWMTGVPDAFVQRIVTEEFFEGADGCESTGMENSAEKHITEWDLTQGNPQEGGLEGSKAATKAKPIAAKPGKLRNVVYAFSSWDKKTNSPNEVYKVRRNGVLKQDPTDPSKAIMIDTYQTSAFSWTPLWAMKQAFWNFAYPKIRAMILKFVEMRDTRAAQ